MSADGILQRARAAHDARPPDLPPRATELQETAARDVGRVLGVEIDPLSVVEHGLHDRYYATSVTVGEVTIRGSYLWGGRDQRFHFAGSLEAEVRTRGCWGFARVRRGPVHTLADVGALAPLPSEGTER